MTTETPPPSQTMNDELSPKLSALISTLGSDKRKQLEALRAIDKADGYAVYRDDPVGFIRRVLLEEPWSIQATIARSVVDNRYTAVPSCFGSGKDWIASRIGAWWVSTGGILLATSNSFPQLKDIYWRELRTAHTKGDLPGQPTWGTDLRWDVGEGQWAIGRKPDDNDPEGLQGIHGARVLVVIDEANGVSPQLWEAVRGAVVNADSRMLAIGNPLEPIGPFFDACRSALWHVIRISVFDTPNFTGELVNPKAANELVGQLWLDEHRAAGYEDTPWWQAKVLGQFPDTASNAIIPLSWVEAARTRPYLGDEREWAGLDVARFGDDDTVLVEGRGNGPEEVRILHGQDTMQTAGLGVNYLRTRSGALAVDVIGVGGGVVDRIKEQRPPGTLLAVNVGENPDRDDDTLSNLRSQVWWDLRVAFDPDTADPLSLQRLDEPAYQRLRSELTAPTYKFNSSGRLVIESKEDMKKRGVPSPDVADALALGLYARSRARRRVTFGAAA